MKKNRSSMKRTKKIRQGDKVVVTAGNCRDQTGTVLKVIHPDQAIVQGLNMRKKHVKPTQENPKGAIVELEKPIHMSNLSVCNDEEKPLKLKCKRKDDGKKVLFYRKGKEEVEYRTL